MSLYLKQFSTHEEYDSYISGSGAILPNVSICTTEGDVHYNPIDPYAGHEYVEIGGLKWATMNIGANSITDKGLYFQWGDTQGYTASQVGSGEGQKYFGWTDYKYGNGTSSPGITGMTKYNASDGKTVLDISDDAARANWGGQWRMPTTEEFVALRAAIDFIDSGGTTITTSNKLTTLSGVTGILVAVKNDHSKRLFFPAAGRCFDGSVDSVGSFGNYWSSSLDTTGDVTFGHNIIFDSEELDWQNASYRYYGLPVRPVVG